MPASWVIVALHLSGWLAATALTLSLGCSLAGRWWRARRPRLVAWRRMLGLSGFALGGLHALLAMGGLLAPRSGTEAAALFDALPYLRHGALALALLAPLVATSFPALNARLGLRTWSTLHRLVYAAIALAVLHVLEGPSADPRAAALVASVVGALLIARMIRPPAQRADAAVDENRSTEP